jgi:D-arginine dehydrogenase
MGTLTADVVIVGAGFAGAATAYQLSRRNAGRLVLVEQEARPGLHSSGRNAALGRQIVTDPAILSLAVEGTRFMSEPPPAFPAHEYLRPTGSLILARASEAAAYQAALPAYHEYGLGARWLDRAAVEDRVPVTSGGTFDGGLHCPEDGIIDIAALLEAFLRASGARLLLGRRVTGLETAGGRVQAVLTDHDERIEAPVVVNAAGAWASSVAALAGASPMPLRPCRRHVVVTGPLEWVDPSWPYAWDVSQQVYFRPELPGLLLSPCDETDDPPGDATADESALALLAEKLERAFPRLSDLPVQRTWAGHRTLTPDGRFVIGPDPKLEGFVWCAGLGGHGVTASAAVGRVAAQAVLGDGAPPEHAPGRFSADRSH